ncbi:MAG: nucleoside deaminase [Alphaproteobacteria bacterium]|nr:nucleoside deaminase [Alphaproteobacteria bacterium]
MPRSESSSPSFMDLAFEEACRAAEKGEVPVGAVVVASDGTVLAQAGNRTETDADPSAHAEILALRFAAKKRNSPRLPDCDLYVTLEPCAMCAAAISIARLRKVVFAAYDPKGGAIEHGPRFFSQPTCHHVPEVVGGVDEERARALLKTFFVDKR